MKTFDWNEENVARLRSMFAEGLSFRQIGRELGTSKNSPLSKARKLGLVREVPLSPMARPANPKPRAARPAQAMPVTLLTHPEPIGPLNEFPADRSCRFIIGEVGKGDWRCCGHEGFPWCEAHRARVFTKGSTRSEKAHAKEAYENSGMARAFGGAA